MARKYVVIAYDISDDKRRNKLAARLEALGWRKQYSVFECFTDEKRLLKTKTAIEEIIEPDEDTVIYYPLCANCHANIERIGVERGGSPDDDLIII